jgi:hypothetical protein
MDDKSTSKDVSQVPSSALKGRMSESDNGGGRHSHPNRERKEDKKHKHRRRKRKSDHSSDDRERKRKRRKRKTKRRHRSSKNSDSDSDSFGHDGESSKSSSGSDSSYRKKGRKRTKKKSNSRKRQVGSAFPHEVETSGTDDAKLQTLQPQVTSSNETYQKSGIHPSAEIVDGGSATIVSRRMVPMSREEYAAEQSQIREVYDPDSGRVRLVRGRGEIIERIVTKEMHQSINQQATRCDGTHFSKTVFQATTSKRT